MYATITKEKQIVLNEWRALMESALQGLRGIAEEAAAASPAPGKWSAKEVMGHLCDSAWNNYCRMIEVQTGPAPYRVRKYAQDDWVRLAGYREWSWDDILNLWALQNGAMIRVVANSEDRYWTSPVVAGEERSFGFLVCDFVEHMRHHLRQVGAMVGLAVVV